MDSLDLGRLADNLPSSSEHGARAMQAAEAELQSAFRNSALCITQMLKAGQKSSKRAFQAGYSTALHDVLEYLQSSLDINVEQPTFNEGIAQVIDYIEARQEALRFQGQDLEADEEPHQQGHHNASNAAPIPSTSRHGPAAGSFSPATSSHHHQQAPQALREPSTRQPYAQSAPQQAVASTSTLSSATHQRKQRNAPARSLSPVVARTQRTASTSSSGPARSTTSQAQQSQHPYAQRPALPTTSSHNDARHHVQDASQASIPLTSSSSIPNSPEARFAPELPLLNSNASQNTEHPSSTPPPGNGSSTTNPAAAAADPNFSSASTAVSPMTRLQAKRERERHRSHGRATHHHHNHHHGHSHDNSSAQVASSIGMKRRWTAALLPEQHTINLSMNLGSPAIESEYNVNLEDDGEDLEGNDDDDDDQDEEGDNDLLSGGESGNDMSAPPAVAGMQRKNSAAALAASRDDNEMDTDDSGMHYRVDGNARPTKRVARR